MAIMIFTEFHIFIKIIKRMGLMIHNDLFQPLHLTILLSLRSLQCLSSNDNFYIFVYYEHFFPSQISHVHKNSQSIHRDLFTPTILNFGIV